MKEQGFWNKCVNHALDKGVRDAMQAFDDFDEDAQQNVALGPTLRE